MVDHHAAAIQLRDYQHRINNEVAAHYAKGTKSVIVQAATGSGKTITFSALCKRFTSKVNKRIVIAVHREELLKQTRLTLLKNFDICAQSITAKYKEIRPAKVYVGMVETMNNILRKNPDAFGDVGMLICDEVHIGNFKKLYEFYPNTFRVGFSATPISATKKHPLKQDYHAIVTAIDTPELIRQGALVQNETWGIKGVKRKSLQVKNGKFDESFMSAEFSQSKNVQNCVIAYMDHCAKTHPKAIVFNCNIQHSKLVTKAFLAAGYNAKHLDGNSSDREDLLRWLKVTPDAILNSVGVLTTGFDETSVQSVIVNRSTMSLPLWLQMTGRGSRPHQGKKTFNIIDLGGNALDLGDWSTPRDWEDLFYNPEKSGAGGVAPVKECKGCEAIISASAKICIYCGYDHTREVQYDTIVPEFERITTAIHVLDLEKQAREAERHKWKAFFDILNAVIKAAQKTGFEREYKPIALQQFELKIKEWLKVTEKRYIKPIQLFTHQQFEKAWVNAFSKN